MKLHLPKLLSVAVMAALALPAMGDTLTSDNVVTPEGKTDSYLNVGTGSSTHTWTGDLVVGDTETTQGDVDKIGAFDDAWNFQTPDGKTLYTNNFKVTGNLTVQGSNGQIVLGGQSGSSYTGLQVGGTVTVDAGTLTATKIITNDLVVNGGKVSTSTGNCTSGNSYSGGVKQSYIKNSLTLTNGSLSFGYLDNVQGIGTGSHRMTSFGSSSSFAINQSGGTMKVYGDMDFKSGSTINQTDNAGLLSLRDTLYMGGSGTTTFNQSADYAKLVIGRFESTGSAWSTPQCDFVFNQSGNGLIHLAYGSNLYKEGTITLNQTGNGTINIGGGHDTAITGALPSRGYALNTVDPNVSTTSFESKNTTYNIDQTGAGTINVKSNATLTANNINVGKDATLNVDGNMTITGKASLTGTVNVGANASFTLAETCDMDVTTDLELSASNSIKFMVDSATTEGSMQMTETGNLEFTGGTLELSLTEAALTEMAAEAHKDGKEFHVTLIGNLSDADVLELEGIINDKLVLADYLVELELPTTYALTAQENITIEAHDLIVEDNALKAVVIATNPNVIPEPATATLSLLALAALAARRRRR